MADRFEILHSVPSTNGCYDMPIAHNDTGANPTAQMRPRSSHTLYATANYRDGMAPNLHERRADTRPSHNWGYQAIRRRDSDRRRQAKHPVHSPEYDSCL